MQPSSTNKRFLSRLSRNGKIFVAVMVPVLCAEATLAYRQIISYAANPCKTEAANLFASTEGGCKDLRTGRVWSRNSGSRERGGTFYSFSPAKSYCDNLVEGGKTDWRLPTRVELKAGAANGAGTYVDAFWQVSGDGSPDFQYDFNKWSSTTYKGGKYAYAVRLGDGTEAGNWATNGNSWTDVVCVR